MKKSKINKILYFIKGIGLDYALYGMKYKFQDTTTDFARLKYGKEKFLKNKLKRIIKKYKNNSKKISLFKENKAHFDKFPIWFCWFQGIENAPEIVKCCYNSLKKNIGANQEIRVITLDNIEKYISIPEHIKNKFEQNKISMALYSDFIRIALLSQYGGFWIDSTVLVTENIENICSNYNFYTKKSDMAELHFGNYLLQGRFAIHLVKADNDNFLINFLYDALSYYHKKFNAPVDYYLTNLLVDMAYKEFSNVKRMFDELPVNDHGFESKLNERIDDYFDENLYNIYLKNMPFQKLSYKSHKFLKTLNNKKTFYGHIYNEYGEESINE